MKTLYLIVINVLLGIAMQAQVTLIPDPNFESLLIAQGIDTDGMVNGQVLTSDIEDELDLVIPEYQGITDLTGIQDFTSLEDFYAIWNDFTEVDFSYNLNLRYISLIGTNLESLDPSNLVNLEKFTLTLGENGTLASLDLSNNLLLSDVFIGGALISEIDLSNNPNIVYLILTHMDDLISINMQNGNNEAITFLRISDNISLECIQVDDPTAVLEATIPPYNSWALFNNNNALITDDCNLGVGDFDTSQVAVFPNPVHEYLYIEAQEESIQEITIYDMSGRLILQKGIDVQKVDVSTVSEGIFLVKITTDKCVITKEVIKE